MEKKKKHHFVSQFYLRQWAKENDRLFTNIKDEIVKKTTVEVGAENYFYRIKSLKKNQYNLLSGEISLLPDVPMKKSLKTVIDAGIFFNVETQVLSSNEDISDLEARQANLVEEYYCIVEDCVLDAHDKLLRGKYSELDNDEYECIVRFMFHQLTRTQKAKSNIKKGIADILEERGIDFDAYHIASALILSERMTLVAIEKLSTLTVIENDTEINFITNDSPVLNLKTPKDKNIKLYWPISPRKAILLEDSTLSPAEQKTLKGEVLQDKFKNNYFLKTPMKITEADVVEFNSKIWENKNRNAFGVIARDLSYYL